MLTSGQCISWTIKGIALIVMASTRIAASNHANADIHSDPVVQPPSATVVCYTDHELGQLCVREVKPITPEWCAENWRTDWRCEPYPEQTPQTTKTNGETDAH
jgi:hypothetical protein